MSFDPWLSDLGKAKGSDRAEATADQRTVEEKETFILLYCTINTESELQ
jgi:hypothetical protein